MTEPIDDIIPRGLDKGVEGLLGNFSKFIEEIVNYGSHILLWDTEVKRQSESNIPIMLSFRHFLDLIDSVSVLVQKGAADLAKLLL